MIETIFHGHAFVEILNDQGTILIDPFITNNPVCDSSLEQIFEKNVTHIIITHGHADHVGDTIALAQHFPHAQVITVYGVAKYLTTQGVSNVHGFGIGGTYQDDHCSIKFVTAIHDGTILETGLSTHPSGVVIMVGGKRMYHMGDSALTLDFGLLKSTPIDVVFVPIGGTYTMDVDDALAAIALFTPKVAVPIHYNTRPKLKADDQRFARECMANNYAVPKVLKPGQAVVL